MKVIVQDFHDAARLAREVTAALIPLESKLRKYKPSEPITDPRKYMIEACEKGELLGRLMGRMKNGLEGKVRG